MSQIIIDGLMNGSKEKHANGAINGHSSRRKARDARGRFSAPRAECSNAHALDNHDSRERDATDERRTSGRKAWRLPARSWFTGEARDRLLVVLIFAVPAVTCGAAFMHGLMHGFGG